MEENKNVTMDEEFVEETIDQTEEEIEQDEIKPAAVEKKRNFFDKHPKATLAAKITGGVVISAIAIYGGVKVGKIIVRNIQAKKIAKKAIDVVSAGAPAAMIEMNPGVAPVVETVTESVVESVTA